MKVNGFVPAKVNGIVPSKVNGLAFSGSSFAYLTGATSNHASGGNGSSTGSFDSTGAGLIIVAVAYFTGGSFSSISDNAGNTYTPLSLYSGDGDPGVRIYYALAPSTRVSHTVTVSGGSIYCGFEVACFSGGSAFESESGASAVRPGSLTPSVNGCLLVCMAGAKTSSGQPTSIDSGFTVSTNSASGAGESYGSGLAYLIQATAAAVNPAWDASNNTAMAVFKP